MGQPYIEFAVKALSLNKIWTTRMDCKHISIGYSNTDVNQESLFLQKKRGSTESGTFRCYRRLEEPSNYSARIVYVDSLIVKASPLKI